MVIALSGVEIVLKAELTTASELSGTCLAAPYLLSTQLLDRKFFPDASLEHIR